MHETVIKIRRDEKSTVEGIRGLMKRNIWKNSPLFRMLITIEIDKCGNSVWTVVVFCLKISPITADNSQNSSYNSLPCLKKKSQ